MIGYQYVVLRVVPRVDREEFVNVGVVLFAQQVDVLAVRTEVDEARLRALAPAIDLDAVHSALAAVDAVCRGDQTAGLPHPDRLGRRFGWVSAPRSTVVQPGPVHGGLTDDPLATLERLVERLVLPC
ncbi:MAG TPA: DUF3037 domain-containing protein [Dermatophilaceae bacterium]|nr:DUF3037 domain-containing protein [Dermatophilaceae bacterium]